MALHSLSSTQYCGLQPEKTSKMESQRVGEEREMQEEPGPRAKEPERAAAQEIIPR